MLLHLARAKLGEAVRDASADWLGLIKHGIWSDVQYLIPTRLLPGRNQTSEKVHLSRQDNPAKVGLRIEDCRTGRNCQGPGPSGKQ
jgi:hypothetical protein